MIAWEYFCSLCNCSISAGQRDAGEAPLEVDCITNGCEYKMTLQDITEALPEYLLIRPSFQEGRAYMLHENKKYRDLGFSAIECGMLYEYEQRKINAGILILIKK